MRKFFFVLFVLFFFISYLKAAPPTGGGGDLDDPTVTDEPIPLDDNVGWLLVSTACVGGWYLRKKQLANSVEKLS